MNTIIELSTDRLFLRPVTILDAEALYTYRSDAETNKYQGWVPKSIDDAQNFISKVAEKIDEYNTWFQFAITSKVNGELIGDVGIHFFDTNKYQVVIGCTIAKNHQGKGFASEALKAVINYLFSELNKRRITCSIDPRNINSIRMVEGLGFRKEAHFKQSVLINGEWFDDVIYALLKDDFKNMNG